MKRINTLQPKLAILLAVLFIALAPVAMQLHAQTPGAESPPPAEAPLPPKDDPAPPPPAEEPLPADDPAPPPPADPPPADDPPPPLPADPPPADDPLSPPPDEEPTEEPTTEPTEEPTTEATEEPTTEATEEPTTEVTEEPTTEATEEAEPEGDSTPEGEIEDKSGEDVTEGTPTPTEEPAPVVTWSQPSPVDCRPTSAGFVGFDHNQTETYRCSASIEAQGEPEMPEGMTIEWALEASFWDELDIQLPSGSQGTVLTSNDVVGVDTRSLVVSLPWQNDSSVQPVEFDLIVTRTVCDAGDNPITVQALPTVENADANVEIRASGSTPERAVETATFLPNLEPPTLTMQPIDFGYLEWDGESWDTSTVNGVITVTNDGCATPRAYVVKVDITSSDAAMLPVVTGVVGGNEGVLDSIADNSPATVATVPAGFAGSTDVVVEFSLTPATDAEPGDHNMTVWLSIDSAP